MSLTNLLNMDSVVVIDNFFQVTKFAQEDVKLTRSYFNYCGLFGIFPFLKKEPFSARFFSKCYVLVFLVLLLLGGVGTLLGRIHLAYKYMEIAQIVGDLLEYFLQLFFVLFVLCSALRHSETWRRNFEDLAEVDNKLGLTGLSINFHANFHYMKIVLYQVMFVSINLFTAYSWTVRLSLLICYIFFRVVQLYQLILVIFICELTGTIKRRYVCLGTHVTEIVTKRNEKVSEVEMSNFKLIYALLGDIVERVNAHFGPHIFLDLACLFMNLLNSFNWYLFNTEQDVPKFQTERRFSHFFLDPLILCICLAGIVMSCDRVERSGQEIVRTCYILQGKVDKGPLRDELVLLTNYVEGLAPKISAWGFFQVNQRLLCGLFATFATYLIIILQFRKV